MLPETATPPVLGKEEQFLREIRLFLIYFLLINPLFAIDISFNGAPSKTYSFKDIKKLTYQIPLDPDFRKGISLNEILPLTSGAHEIRILANNSKKIWTGDNLAEELSEWYLLESQSGMAWDLSAEGTVLENVSEIELYGTPLSQTQLEVWVSWEGVPLLKKEISRFAASHNVDIRVVEVPKTQSKLISVLRGKGKLPDVVMIQSDYLPSLVKARALQNLDYFHTSSLVQKGMDAFSLEGKSWGIPFYFDTQLVFYNRKIIQEPPSIDWNLRDMEKVAYSALQQGLVPAAWNAYSVYWLIPFQIGFGKQSIIEADGSIRIDDPATEKALEYILDLKHKGLLGIMERDAMISLFASGKIAMILSGSYSIPLFSELKLDFGIAPYPFNPDTNKYISPLLDFKGWAITRKTRNPILARRLIQYLTGIGVQQRFSNALSKLPANTNVWEIIETKNPYCQVLLKSFEIGTPVPPDKAYLIYKGTMWKLLRFAVSEQMSIKETLSRGQKIINANLLE